MDTYKNFAELVRFESAFSIEQCDRDSDITVLAPHGGRIEPHTTEIARLIAAGDYNYYCFNGQKPGCNQELHIASHRYDEPQALRLARKARLVIAVHGCAVIEPMVFLGGLATDLIAAVSGVLDEQAIPNRRAGGKYGGVDRNNICNLGSSGRGLQLEISRPLRDDPANRIVLADSVRSAVDRTMKQTSTGPKRT